jgi:hypothetical protein
MGLVSKVGGVAAILAAAILVVGVAAAALQGHRVRPWLITLLLINAGRAPRDTLRGAEPVDIALLALAGVTYAGFWTGHGAGHVWWLALAVGQPLLGILVLVVTRLWGRSGLMGGAVVLSVLMLIVGVWTAAGWWGLAANLLLLVGDFSTTGRRSRLLTALLTVGYAGLVGWLGWVAVLLLGTVQ